MKSISELTDFYYKTLYPILEKLDNEREVLKQKIIKIGIFYTLFIATVGYLIFANSYNSFDFIILYLFGAFALGGYFYKYFIKDYKNDFKEKVIAPLIYELDNNLSYMPERHIQENYFRRSKLFLSKPDRVSGNDYISGEIDNVPIQFSDFHAEKKYKDSKGNTNWRTLFQGLFIISEFNKHFKGETIILPDSAQNNFGDLIGGWLQANNVSRDELVKMDNPEFEKEFVVYSNDQVEARYILSHTLMQKLLNYKKRSKHPIYVSFIGGNIYMAIAYDKDLFEPSVFHSLLKYKIAMEYLGTLHLAVGVVEELKLNQKLWSKL